MRLLLLFFRPRYSIAREWKNNAMQYRKVQKSSWNEPYSSSSFTKQSCSKMALYRWIRMESRWNKKQIFLSSPDWSANLRPSLERKTRLDALIGPNDSTATGWKMWWAWMPLLRICSNRPHVRRRRDAGPSAPNLTDGRTYTGPSHNIYRASIASRDKNLVYLCVGHPRSLKMVPLDRRRNFLGFLLFQRK